MHYAEGERDMVMLQHKFVVEWADGREVSLWISSFLQVFGVLVLPYLFVSTLFCSKGFLFRG